MDQLQKLWKCIQETGEDRPDRTGVGTRGVFGYQMRFNLRDGFPLSTLRFTSIKAIAEELRWFISGSTNINDLNSSIWNEWALEEDITTVVPKLRQDIITEIHQKMVQAGDDIMSSMHDIHMMLGDELLEKAAAMGVDVATVRYLHRKGDLGPIYGKQWRRWPIGNGFVDQLGQLVYDIKTNPKSRRLIMSAWNPTVLPKDNITPQENVKCGRQALAPCHTMVQFYVSNLNGEGKPILHCQLYQRSGDALVGVPYNVASYALLTHLIAKHVDMDVGDFVHTLGDAHIYQYATHAECYATLMDRVPKALPTLIISEEANLFNFTADDITVDNYDPHPKLPFRMEVAV